MNHSRLLMFTVIVVLFVADNAKAQDSTSLMEAFEKEGTENQISVERRNFNEAVQSYNVLVKRFPSMIIARLSNFKPKPYFQAQAGAETAPKVNFDFGKPAETPAKP